MIDLIKTRRELHQIPEIGLEEFETHKYLMEKIGKIAEKNNFTEIRTWNTGILVMLHGSDPEKTIGWRTDIDGLPIVEETGLEFKSIHEGRMHACGHDCHMTIALGLLDQLSLEQPKNNMLFLFQPAEENEAGGMLMYKDGAFGDWLPDEFYGLHVNPDLPVGTIASNNNTLFAGTCEIEITFKGLGGHAAFPHNTRDALVAAATFVTQVQTVVSRNVNPIEGAVVTIGSFHAGNTHNIISEVATVKGTIRTLTAEMNELTQKRVRQIAEGVAMSFDLDVEVSLNQKGYLPVENNLELADNLMSFFNEEEGVNLLDVLPSMTGEDFGYLLHQVPGVMFWLGIDSPYALHHPKMSPDEKALSFGVENIAKFLKSRI
ncbi:N-acetyldiaminopimelate deacetylase [Floricoccus penangensis]|uniref:N-acetyldiaminopimelate deacetylase n=1 Tax=Floricoccus penangensis TaxID=1859475 RepID=A0A9Q5P0P8_9LACT|nr:N-acetyldiaminopimelate deacetylase [Floricoccus penangensis]OFI47237.1 N-acetyldiaminopimelate deacetylase [Floricoccus penangensis]